MASQTPDTLVKFCNAETGKQILASRRLRWSSPALFSDPFELDHRSQLGFDGKRLLQAAVRAASAMIFAPDEPSGNTPLINAVRRWRAEERFSSPEEAYDVLGELLGQVADGRQEVIDGMMEDWRRFTRTLRICCFTARPDNPVAWQHFAAQHQGIALRFHCGEGTALEKPRRVNYRAPRPEISNLRDELSVILGASSYRAQDHFLEKFIAKPAYRAPESEWRCLQHIKEEAGSYNRLDSQWYDDIRFDASDLHSIYFGALTPIEAKRELEQLARENFGPVKLFQAKTTPGKYEIEFERLGKR
ncbi:DUF2971 domain-containing protein [Pseudomaricurvus alkylphenolicus]|uniref:DUF2971 domain-containing protein n=1 Tax=Pseudomaricurvus alkylphenolicus TaxID=1306991 RepID=UPI00141D896D|nr:DUF2971 domain-containing protein [Pseudomaricurvus alkylphenolicus]NIB41960.1 DUF2971 domain-containing protein [Pseudomaricurvus alkylphenolicus]